MSATRARSSIHESAPGRGQWDKQDRGPRFIEKRELPSNCLRPALTWPPDGVDSRKLAGERGALGEMSAVIR